MKGRFSFSLSKRGLKLVLCERCNTLIQMSFRVDFRIRWRRDCKHLYEQYDFDVAIVLEIADPIGLQRVILYLHDVVN